MAIGDLPDVRVGDVWKDNDPRGGPTVEVKKLCGPDQLGCPSSHLGPHAHVVTVSGGKRLRPRTIVWRRFRPVRSGYRLIERAPSDPSVCEGATPPETRGDG